MKINSQIRESDGHFIIKYDFTDGINEKVDLAISKTLKTLGYKFIGSGYNLRTGIRDLEFKHS